MSGAIVEHQNSLVRLYRKLEERFEENSIIRTLWHDMADDVSQQIQSIKSFPPSLWNQFKNAPDDGFESVVKIAPPKPTDVTDISLRDCFEISIVLTEPVVLKMYARVVKLLRKNSTAPALNFYFLVKAYIARLVRTTESFAGDPLLIRRAQLLLQGFEKEVQEPAPEIKPGKPVNPFTPRTPSVSAQKAPDKVPAKAPVAGKTAANKAKETAKTPPKNAKTAASKPVKAAPVKVKTPLAKKPAAAKRS